MPKIKVHFYGASKTVTGSKFLLETPQLNILVDCGMFQGIKEIRKLNWSDLPFDASAIDTVLLTHGHLDHTGYLPRLVKQGFRGTIHGTPPTMEITKIILLDSGKIHEEGAKKANKENYSKHDPALPLYTIEDAERTIDYFNTIDQNVWLELSEDIKCRFRYNGHILGATFIEIDVFGKRFVFSGDVGRINDPLLFSPEKPKWADYLFIESTYGDKLHPPDEFEELVVDLVKKTIHNKGTLIIPSFAVERIQTIMYMLWDLYKRNKIPNIPMYIDSPMGNNVIDVFKLFPEWHKLTYKEYLSIVRHFNITKSYKETWENIDNTQPKIVIAGSGMVTGGRVLTYLQQLIDIPTTNILLVGYQAEGTRGRDLIEGAHEIKFFGKYYPVHAKVYQLGSLSAHADQFELIDWLNNIRNIPETVYLIHGESNALEIFKTEIQNRYNWNVIIPELHDIYELIV